MFWREDKCIPVTLISETSPRAATETTLTGTTSTLAIQGELKVPNDTKGAKTGTSRSQTYK